MLKSRWQQIFVPACAAALVLFCASIFISPDSHWYNSLIKPMLIPPNIVFTIAWPCIYASCALSAIIICMSEKPVLNTLMYLFGINGALNALWTYLFFEKHHLAASLLLIMITVCFAVLLFFRAKRVQRVAGYLIIPYIAWLAYAMALNYAITMMN